VFASVLRKKSKELILINKPDLVYISDNELDFFGYTKQGLIWIIEGVRYRCYEATAKGHYFVRID
jgi:hypothetical protein